MTSVVARLAECAYRHLVCLARMVNAVHLHLGDGVGDKIGIRGRIGSALGRVADTAAFHMRRQNQTVVGVCFLAAFDVGIHLYHEAVLKRQAVTIEGRKLTIFSFRP